MTKLQIEILKKKKLRADVIEALYSYYGEDISLSVLKGALPLSGMLKEEDLRQVIYYLGGVEKKYIHLELNKDDYMSSLIWLTPRGVNLAEKDITDVGVKVYE